MLRRATMNVKNKVFNPARGFNHVFFSMIAWTFSGSRAGECEGDGEGDTHQSVGTYSATCVRQPSVPVMTR
jgi:hypothetical protein